MGRDILDVQYIQEYFIYFLVHHLILLFLVKCRLFCAIFQAFLSFLFVRRSVRLYVCQIVWLSVCLFVCLSLFPCLSITFATMESLSMFYLCPSLFKSNCIEHFARKQFKFQPGIMYVYLHNKTCSFIMYSFFVFLLSK